MGVAVAAGRFSTGFRSGLSPYERKREDGWAERAPRREQRRLPYDQVCLTATLFPRPPRIAGDRFLSIAADTVASQGLGVEGKKGISPEGIAPAPAGGEWRCRSVIVDRT